MTGESKLPDNDDIQDLLKAFERLCAGRGNGFLSEESFERIIDHFDDINSLSKAMEAAEMGVLQYPYSCTLRIVALLLYSFFFAFYHEFHIAVKVSCLHHGFKCLEVHVHLPFVITGASSIYFAVSDFWLKRRCFP